MTDEEIEAANIKYWTARIVRLSNGRFALFDPFVNGIGMPLKAIGSIEEIAPFIPTVEEVQSYARAQKAIEEEERAERRKVTAADIAEGTSLLVTLGLLKPAEPLKRRA